MIVRGSGLRFARVKQLRQGVSNLEMIKRHIGNHLEQPQKALEIASEAPFVVGETSFRCYKASRPFTEEPRW